MLFTTFAKAKKVGACIESYEKVVDALGGIGKYGENTPIPLTKIKKGCSLVHKMRDPHNYPV